MDNTAEQYEKRKRHSEKVEEFKRKMAEEYARRQQEEQQIKSSENDLIIDNIDL